MIVDDELDISSPSGFAIPDTPSQSIKSRNKPGPLSTKGKTANEETDSIDLTSDEESDSDNSLKSKMSTTQFKIVGGKRKRIGPYGGIPTTGEYNTF